MTIRPFIAVRPLSPDEGWRLDASCRDYDPELFFPMPTHRAGNDEAKAVCRLCPVQAECLEEGLRGFNRYGVWGGTTEDERAPLISARLRSAK